MCVSITFISETSGVPAYYLRTYFKKFRPPIRAGNLKRSRG